VTDQLITESSCTAVVKAPIEFVDISTWLFDLPDAEYQRCSPAHIAAAATRTDDERRMSINVETIDDDLPMRKAVGRLLESEDYPVEMFIGGARVSRSGSSIPAPHASCSI